MYIEKKINENTSVISNKVTAITIALHTVFVSVFVRVRACVCVPVSVCQSASLSLYPPAPSLPFFPSSLPSFVPPSGGRLFTFCTFVCLNVSLSPSLSISFSCFSLYPCLGPLVKSRSDILPMT